MHSSCSSSRTVAARLPSPGRLPATLLLLSASCIALVAADSVVHQVPHSPAEPALGIPYFLPKPILVVRTTPELDAAGRVKGIKVEVEKQTVADRAQAFRLLTRNGVFTASTASFEVEDGLLSSVNADAESKAPDALASIATFFFSLQTIPALQTQLGGLAGPGALWAEMTKGLDLAGLPAGQKGTWSLLKTQSTAGHITVESIPPDPDVVAFLSFVRGRDFDGSVGEFVGPDSDKLAKELSETLKEARTEISSQGQPITFDQLMAGVDVESLKRSFVHAQALDEQPPAFPLGDRLNLDARLDFGDACASPSRFEPAATPAATQVVHPGGAMQRPASTRTTPSGEPAYRDRVLVRGERPVTITLTLRPNVAKSAALLRESLSTELAPRAALIQAKQIKDAASWQAALRALKAEATQAVAQADDAVEQHFRQLESWLVDKSDLSDGRAAFNAAVLPLFTAGRTASIAQLTTAAEKSLAKTRQLELNFATFRKKVLLNLAKIHLARSSALEFRGDWYFSSQVVVTTFPAPEAYQIPLERLALGKATTGLKLSRGQLRSFAATRAAPAAEIAALPARIVSPYIALLKELITIRVSTLDQSDDVLEKQVAITKLEQDLAALRKSPDADAVAHDAAVTQLTRTRDLLELQQKILELQEATQAAQPEAVAQGMIANSLALQQQVTNLQGELSALPE